MIYEDACRILDLSGEEPAMMIKKRYRQLMHQVHPDALGDRKADVPYCAWEINAAYELLMKRKASLRRTEQTPPSGSKARNRWQAPQNEHAYMERNIYADHICIASGKYYYSEEETFPMFLYSIYHCSRKMLEGFPDTLIQKYLGEAAYLLSQQFVNRDMILKRYETDISAKGMIYYFPAMLETVGRGYAYAPGTVLAPGRVQNHRLYLKSPSGKEAGYLSFHDDLIYYALIPLFEQRIAEIKVRVSGSAYGHNNVRAVKVRTLDLWVRLSTEHMKQIEVRLSEQIKALLNQCRMEADG